MIEKSQPENNIPQTAVQHTPLRQPIKNIECVIYDTELENSLKNMRNKPGFFQTIKDPEHGWMWKGYPVKNSSGTEVEFSDKKFNITPGIQRIVTDTSNIPLKKLNDKVNERFINILKILEFEDYKKTCGEFISGKHSETIFKKRVKKSDLEGQGVKTIIPSNIVDIYTRLEILQGLKLSGHTITLTEASHLIDELYKRSEKQNKQQYQNALKKIKTL